MLGFLRSDHMRWPPMSERLIELLPGMCGCVLVDNLYLLACPHDLEWIKREIRNGRPSECDIATLDRFVVSDPETLRTALVGGRV